MNTHDFSGYLAECRELVLDQIRELIPKGRYGPILYDLMLDYPLRQGKCLRPALCIATVRALGGRLQDAVPTAAVLELYHNAFLVHDDVEDGSLMRRGYATLYRDYGVPIAVNVGDGMLALALEPLLANTRWLGLGRALRILETISTMSRESVEGQAIELDWMRRGAWQLSDGDYWQMVFKKTCWYTFLSPLRIGAQIAGAEPEQLDVLNRFATLTGVAFQIQDDVLNLTGDEKRYGKEILGDLYEGKRTLVLLHMLRSVSAPERDRAIAILQVPRLEKTARDVDFLMKLIDRSGSIDYAHSNAVRLARRAAGLLDEAREWLPDSGHRDFLRAVPSHVVGRES
jgi:geranylgeranyl diphosphate synthase type II